MATNPPEVPSLKGTVGGQESAEDQRQTALCAVQAMIAESVKTAVVGVTQELMKAVDEKLAMQSSTPASTTMSGTLPSTGGSISLPSGGQMSSSGAMAGIPVVGVVPSPLADTVLSSSSTAPISSPSTLLSAVGSSQVITPTTPLASILPPVAAPLSAEAIAVGSHSPPIPKKLADKIWKGKFIELSELLPCRLGAPEVTLMDLMSNRDRPKESKKITTIQQWVVCFNSFTSVMAVHHPERVRDLLVYASIITKASLDYEGTPWLAYDGHFRRVAAASKLQDWSQVDASLWTLCFTSAKRSLRGAGGLAVVPTSPEEQKQGASTTPARGEENTQRGSNHYSPYPWICRR